MNTYYETFLRKDIFADNQSYADTICDIYDQNPQEKAHVERILDWYLNGGSAYSAYSMLKGIINKVQRIKDTHSYLDEEYHRKLKEEK